MAYEVTQCLSVFMHSKNWRFYKIFLDIFFLQKCSVLFLGFRDRSFKLKWKTTPFQLRKKEMTIFSWDKTLLKLHKHGNHIKLEWLTKKTGNIMAHFSMSKKAKWQSWGSNPYAYSGIRASRYHCRGIQDGARWQDNAGCFQCANTILSCNALSQKTGIRVRHCRL